VTPDRRHQVGRESKANRGVPDPSGAGQSSGIGRVGAGALEPPPEPATTTNIRLPTIMKASRPATIRVAGENRAAADGGAGRRDLVAMGRHPTEGRRSTGIQRSAHR